MTRRTLIVAYACASFALVCAAAPQKATTPSKPDRDAIATENVKQLLLLMDTDKNGKISKQEWMRFMSVEFDRLDTDKSGELDPHELLQSRVAVRHVRPADQGK